MNNLDHQISSIRKAIKNGEAQVTLLKVKLEEMEKLKQLPGAIEIFETISNAEKQAEKQQLKNHDEYRKEIGQPTFFGDPEYLNK